MKTLNVELAREAKAIVALAFRNGPIEDIHAGKVCSVCDGSSGYSRITEDEMKAAVNAVYDMGTIRFYRASTAICLKSIVPTSG